MFKNYLKLAVRSLLRNKTHSLINICGLSVGMACFILIILWVQDELSYEDYHVNGARIARVIWDIDGFKIPATPGPFANWLKESIASIEDATRINHGGDKLIYKDQKINAAVRYVEPKFFEIFSFEFIKGDPKTAMDEVSSVLITESIAKTLFGDDEPLGKTIMSAGGNQQYPKKVTGVLKDIPRLTHSYLRDAQCFYPLELMRFWREPDSWRDAQDYKTYVLLNENTSAGIAAQEVNREFKKMVEKHDPDTAKKYKQNFYLQPLSRVHLHSDFKFDGPHGSAQYVVFFTLIAIFILIIAWVNYMNLTTARSLKRAREIGLRKVVGANRFQLVKQFLGESTLISASAMVFALLFVELFLPTFNRLSGKPLLIDYSNINLLIGLFGLLILTGITAGSYPALFLSSFSPVKVIKDQAVDYMHIRSSTFRRFLVICQFAISIFIIIATLVVYQQLDFMKNKELGFEKENLLYLKTEGFSDKYESIRTELSRYPDILSVAASGDMPLEIGTNSGADWEGKEKNMGYISFPSLFVTEDFLETFKLKIAKGRFFSKDFISDKTEAFVVNEAAVEAMGLQNPVGKKFSALGKQGFIVGVVNDFHFRSLRSAVEPLILQLQGFIHLHVRINRTNVRETLERVKKVYRNYYPDQEIEVHFFDAAIDEFYQAERRMGQVFMYFSLLAIVISCLGLLGLVSFISENKTKEIGIRKVHGASIGGIVTMLTRDFTKWVLLANIIAWPVAYFLMNNWLQNFAYRIEITFLPFFLAGVLALVIALLTVSFQAIKAAVANPVKALRYE